MKYLLMLLLTALVFSGLTGLDMSLAPGLSVKNLFLYLAAALLFLRVVLTKDVRFELPGFSFAFAVLLAYAVSTWLVVGLVLEYEGYSFLGSAMPLKNKLFDFLLIFWVFFYGLTRAEAVLVLRYMLAVFTLGHALGLLYYYGYVDLEGLYNPYDERLRGFIGEVNQYGTLNACFLPVTIAQAVVAKKWPLRAFWAGAAVLSVAALLLSGSRGAVVGLLIGASVLFLFYRKYLPMGKIALGAGFGLAALVVVVLVLGATTGNYLSERFVGDSQTAGLGNISSGRTDIWVNLLRLMADSPVTFLTGYGWNAYFSLPFRQAPHNTYLHHWFDLGLIGLAAISWLLWYSVKVLRRGVADASGDTRVLLIGASVGVTAVAVSAFFGEFPVFWPFFWMLVGLGARLAVSRDAAQAADTSAHAEGSTPAGSSGLYKDSFGWVQRPSTPSRA